MERRALVTVEVENVDFWIEPVPGVVGAAGEKEASSKGDFAGFSAYSCCGGW